LAYPHAGARVQQHCIEQVTMGSRIRSRGHSVNVHATAGSRDSSKLRHKENFAAAPHLGESYVA